MAARSTRTASSTKRATPTSAPTYNAILKAVVLGAQRRAYGPTINSAALAHDAVGIDLLSNTPTRHSRNALISGSRHEVSKDAICSKCKAAIVPPYSPTPLLPYSRDLSVGGDGAPHGASERKPSFRSYRQATITSGTFRAKSTQHLHGLGLKKRRSPKTTRRLGEKTSENQHLGKLVAGVGFEPTTFGL